MDKETQKLMSEGESWKAFVEGEMWNKCKSEVMQNVLAVDSISTLPEGVDLQVEVKSRKLAKQIVLEWIAEIEGNAGQYELNKELTREDNTGEYVTRHE